MAPACIIDEIEYTNMATVLKVRSTLSLTSSKQNRVLHYLSSHKEGETVQSVPRIGAK